MLLFSIDNIFTHKSLAVDFLKKVNSFHSLLLTYLYGIITFMLDPSKTQPNNPLHGIKLADILEQLVEVYGFKELGTRIPIRCFNLNPSIKSSLKFLRKTPCARSKVEQLYLRTKSGEN